MAGNSGYVDFTGDSSTLRVYWSESVTDSAGAKSTVSITSIWLSTNGLFGGTWNADLVLQINGTNAVTLSQSDGNGVYLNTGGTFYEVKKGDASITRSVSNIAHNADGSKSINIRLKPNNFAYAGFWSYPYNTKQITTAYIDKAITLYTLPVGTLSTSAGTGVSSLTVKRGSATISSGTKLYYGDVLTVSWSIATGYTVNTHTVNGSTINNGGSTGSVTGNVSVAVTAKLLTYTLSISAGTGSTITVKRGTTTLSNGATLTYGDVLTITFGTSSSAYNLGTHTVNGSTFTSGSTHTVAGAVSVVSTASLKTYTLTISQGSNSTITVKRNNNTLSNGATLTYGDVLTITFAAAPGYAIGTHTVNGTAFTSGGTHTVSGAVTVVSSATQTTFTLSLTKGSNTNLTVSRNGTTLSNGDSLTYGDVLTITFSAAGGYTLTKGTVNGSAFTSGNTYTVTSNVTVVTQATANPYPLTITQGNNTVITVMRGTQQLYNGDQIATNDVLTISFAATSGYAISIHTVNGSAFTSGDTLTVSGAVTVVSAAVTVGQLAEPTNVSPDTLNGTGCVDATQDLTVTWQVNGNVSMTAYQIVIYENNSASTQVYTTGQVALSTPFWGHDYEGNVQYFSATISAAALSSAGVVNGNEYKLVITQWWGASAYITQNTASVFVTRAAASVAVSFAEATGTTQTFVGTYTQENGAPLNWVRWTIYQGAATGTALYDSGQISGTGILRVDWDGMMPEVTYTVVCEVETSDGDRASGSLSHTIAVGNDYVFSGDVSVCQQPESGIIVSWTPQPFVASYTVHRRVAGDATFVKVADVNRVTNSITDYGAAAQTPYIYYVFPTIGGAAQQPGISEEFTADFRVWSILRTAQKDKQTFSVTKRYAFRMGFGGVNEGGISNNNSPSLLQNFTRYPMRQTSSANYLSGSVSGFIGSVANGQYSDTVAQARELMELSQTSDPLFLCDTKGHLLRIQTAGSVGVTVQTKSRVQPQTLTLPWAEIGDASNIAVLNDSELLAAFSDVETLSTPARSQTSLTEIQAGSPILVNVTTNGTYGGGDDNGAYLIFYDASETQIGSAIEVSGDLNNGVEINAAAPSNAAYMVIGWYLGTDTTTSTVKAVYA